MTKTVQTLVTRLRAVSVGLAVAMVLVPAVAAQAQTLTVLYSFTGGADGGYPVDNGSLVRDAAGNLYGTTVYGGTGGCNTGYDSGCGTVFTVDTTGKETVLYSFTGIRGDGEYPSGGLVRDAAGNLYGTTDDGGAYGCGSVFMVDKTGKETVLYSFCSAQNDGTYPGAGLLRDAAGNLYGTTAKGGASNAGTVFKLDKAGKQTVLHSFTGGADGGVPYAGLIRDAAGNLYGTTAWGGTSDDGTVFKLDTTGKETVLHSFKGRDGENPYGGLVRDAAGNLYGTTYDGGAYNTGCWGEGQEGCGVVFKLAATGKETVLHSFQAPPAGPEDGALPSAGLVRDAAGNLYGTTTYGGESPCGCGTLFKVGKNGKETVLYTFTGGTDGGDPYAGLVRDAKGNLHGTALESGFGDGTVFTLTP